LEPSNGKIASRILRSFAPHAPRCRDRVLAVRYSRPGDVELLDHPVWDWLAPEVGGAGRSVVSAAI
jgi:hypothetical protein